MVQLQREIMMRSTQKFFFSGFYRAKGRKALSHCSSSLARFPLAHQLRNCILVIAMIRCRSIESKQVFEVSLLDAIPTSYLRRADTNVSVIWVDKINNTLVFQKFKRLQFCWSKCLVWLILRNKHNRFLYSTGFIMARVKTNDNSTYYNTSFVSSFEFFVFFYFLKYKLNIKVYRKTNAVVFRCLVRTINTVSFTVQMYDTFIIHKLSFPVRIRIDRNIFTVFFLDNCIQTSFVEYIGSVKFTWEFFVLFFIFREKIRIVFSRSVIWKSKYRV